MRRRSVVIVNRYAVAGLLCTAVAGCAAPPPLALNASGGEILRGTAVTTAYTSTQSGEHKEECRASYTGAASSPTVLLELHCSDGRYGIGTGELQNAQLVGGKVRMQDGKEAVVRVENQQLLR